MRRVFVLLLLMSLAGFSQELPKQVGFTWWKIPALKGALLVPEGWHQKERAKGKALGYYVTKTKIKDEKKGFETGLTLNVFKEFEKRKGKDPLVWAKAYRKAWVDGGKVLKSWDKDMGPFRSIGFRGEASQEGKTLVMHQLFVVNSKTGTLYFYLFEAPKDEWGEAWKVGEQIFDRLMIDDEV